MRFPFTKREEESKTPVPVGEPSVLARVLGVLDAEIEQKRRTRETAKRIAREPLTELAFAKK